jgi:hypothetical protein
MESFEAIRGFLAAARSRARRLDATFYSLAAVTALVILLLGAPLVAAGAGAGTAAVVRGLLVLALLGTAGAWAWLAWWRPRQRTQGDVEVARLVGSAAPTIASDLLSSVELERELGQAPEPGRDPRFSAELTLAHAESTATRLHALRPAALFPDAAVRQAARRLAGVCAVHALVLVLWPSTLASGWRRLWHYGGRSAAPLAAVPVPEPLVGDLGITLVYPKYTGRAPFTVPASSGDVTAPRGTQVQIEARALKPAVRAAMVVEGKDERIPLEVRGTTLRTTFVLDHALVYRFELTGERGRPLVELDAHRLELEPDHAPRVELVAPADDLEVSEHKRIELGYAVDDDYGLTELTLVWQARGREGKKKLPLRPGRSAQGKLMWDLADVAPEPGERVAYHLEAKDNDDVSGPNLGVSRSYYLRVYSPRDKHRDLVERQRALFEAAVALLADRLEAPPFELEPRQELGRRTQDLALQLAQLIPLLEKDPLAPKKLTSELDAMRARLLRLAQEEETLLAGFAHRAARAGAPSPKSALSALTPMDQKLVAELEKDVITLDDWLARQQLEEMLAIADDIRQHRDRLAKLMEDYRRTGSDKLRAEIERELGILEALERELLEKRARLGAEVADRFVNSEAMALEEHQDCLGKVRELVAAGDVAGAAKQLEKCQRYLDAGQRALEDGLRGLRGERFSEEEKAYAELLDEINELEREERQIGRDIDELEQRYRERAAEVAKEKGNPARDKAKKLVEKAKKELGKVPRDGLTPFAQEEYDTVMKRLDDVDKMLDDGDVAEALSMARQAGEGLDAVLQDLDDDMSDGEPWSDKTDEALQAAHRSQPTVEDLVDELEKATPKPQEIMSREDRAQMDELNRRQKALEERTRKLGQKAQKQGQKLPEQAGQAAQKGLDEAALAMKGAGKRLGELDPAGAEREAEGAADKLAGLKKGLGQSARPTMQGRGGQSDDGEVKIPGADEYKPPEAFREKVLDAKRKGQAPEDYQEQVEQYYREITK